MPPSTMTILRPQAFAASALASSEGCTAASRTLESWLSRPDTHLDMIIQDLCTVPNLFEFVVSTLPSAKGLVLKILDAYPTAPAQIKCSYANALLQRLSSFLFSLPPDLFSTSASRSIGQYKVYVENAFLALDLLCSSKFPICTITDAGPGTNPLGVPEYADDEFFLPNIQKNKKPKHKNRDVVDMTPLHTLGVKIPSGDSEATDMARDIADNLKTILEFYLGLLLEPSVAQRSKDAYLRPSAPVDVKISRPSPPHETRVVEPTQPAPPAYPTIQPLKAALYFENAEGFGEWRIIIGSDATKTLRELASGDRKKCAIVVKKIRQLSNGHFSQDNQKRLNSSHGVPIFEAKMQRDLRLVYQIDVVADRDREVDRQVIKIYGIYTHTQLNRIWDAVGQHLAGKGKEYQARCTFRNRPVHHGGDVYLPASFPSDDLEYETKPPRLVLSEVDLEQLHSLLVLDKYVAFSQGLLHSLIANQDVQHVFELSPRERSIVECTTSCFVLGRSGTGKTTTMLFKMLGIHRAWEHLGHVDMPQPRQIFVTKSRPLAMRVEEYFRKLLESSALAGCSREDLKKMRAQTTGFRMVDWNDIERDDIPKKYSALEEKHFPLFLTFDQFAEMIAADILDDGDPKVSHAARLFKKTDDCDARDLLVTFETFETSYWPHFPQPLTKGLDAWLVFSEFIGIIKGSEKSLSCPGGVLDEETYCALPARSHPVFASQRQVLYTLFKAYCNLKIGYRQHDAADRTYVILKLLLSGTPFKGKKVDYIYIDEAQDNLLIDALLLRLVCRNPEGLFWAGDTAQTISAGSSFRFNDLKAYLYRIERDQRVHLIQERSVRNPQAFQLAINYRSHGGIVNCAHSVIERITCFWPDAIDGLQQEGGVVDGIKPLFFHGGGEEAVEYEEFLFGKSGDRIEFGADQCILVRDEKAANKLRSEVGNIGVIMTLYDSKGLEFNDVLLYNFFEDSAFDVARWKVLLNYAEGTVDGRDLAEIHAPSFERDKGRFAGICSELKALYVGITRARKKLWISDKSDKCKPMRMIWTLRNQVQNYTETKPKHLAEDAAQSSEAWESSGNELFMHKKYQQAMHCYTRAKRPRMVAICEAFHLREVARSNVGAASPVVQRDAFRVAADAFMIVADDAPTGDDKLQYYRNAAECFARAKYHRKAANSYVLAQEYPLAARQFRKAGLFEKTLEILHKYPQKFTAETLEELLTVCRLFYCSRSDLSRPRFPLFSGFEEELEFLVDYDLDSARATLLESRGRYEEAAEIHLEENRPLDAIKDFLKQKTSRGAAQRATKIILNSLWHRCSFAAKVAEDCKVAELLKLARKLPMGSLNSLDGSEISMFQAIAQSDLANLESLSQVFVNGERRAAALLALDHFFSYLPELKSYTPSKMSRFLAKFREYVHLIHSIISHPDPLSDTSIRQLFCIEKISDTEYSIGRESFLHESATADRQGITYLQAAVSKGDMVMALRRYLAEHLRRRVVEENQLCQRAPIFLQCLTFIVTGQCKRINCPQKHVESTELNSMRYNFRIGIHLQQISILQLMYSVNPRLDTQKEDVLNWLTHIYDAFNPQSHIQGSTANFDLSAIPGAHESLGIMKHWVQEALYSIRPEENRAKFLTNVLKLTSLLFTFDRSSALKCINRVPFNAPCARVPQFMYLDGCYILDDVVRLFDGSQQTCISSGLKFLKHVVVSRLFVDLSVFCDCLEEVISKLCVSWRMSYRPPLDGLVLPRAWLSSNKDFSNKKEVKIALLVHVLDHVRELLKHLQSDDAIGPQGLYRLSHTRLTPILCDIFISRICRALCLLLYNVRNDDVRKKIKEIFEFLRPRARHLYRKYTFPCDCDSDYLRIVSDYDVRAKVAITDLVQLLHRRRDCWRWKIMSKGIEDIQFTNPLDIPSLLAASLVAARSDLCVGAPAFLPQTFQTEKAKDEEIIQPEEPEVEPLDNIHEEPDELPPAQDEPVLVRGHEPTEEEIRAAIIMQSTYRRKCKRREVLSRAFGKGLKAKRNAIFIACLKNVYASNWGKTPYRMLYLWALPRLLVCLDKAIDIAQKYKKKVKDLVREETHERLEELGKQTNTINALLKKGRDLRKKMEPNATMHREKDKAVMKQAIEEVEEIVRGLPSTCEVPEELQGDLKKAYQLVAVTEKRHVAKLQKPTLNTEDLVEY